MKTEEVFFIEVTFWGRVQGVGFRWSTQRVAEEFSVCGCVKNLPNGSVEMVAAGEMSEVRAFLAALKERMATCVESCEVTENLGPRRFNEFAIVY